MKVATLLLAVVLVCEYFTAEAAYKCNGKRGSIFKPFKGKKANMLFPCKYAAVRQRCGKYQITVSPGNVFIGGRFFLNTLLLQAIDKEADKVWVGRTTNKMAIKYINDIGNNQEPFKKIRGDVEASSFLTMSHTSKEIKAEAKDGSFSLTFSPYDVLGKKHRAVGFEFSCNEDDEKLDFPAQMCGGDLGKKAVRSFALEKGIKKYKKKALTQEEIDMSFYYLVFTDTVIDQSPSPQCKDVALTMVNKCADDEARADALRQCYRILYSDEHRECATMFSCDVMDVFSTCITFACSNYTDANACQSLGETLDMCPRIGGDDGLTAKIATCYKELFVPLAPGPSKRR